MKRYLSVLAILTAVATLAACGGKASSDANTAGGAMQNASTAANTATNTSADSAAAMGSDTSTQTPPDCGAVKAVWVNVKTGKYHEPNDPYYGKTKHGEYMCPAAAKRAGYTPAGGGSMESSGKHHKNSE